ncbi:MAG: MFS domain-containing histidine kinase, partial [Patescibacteria group bacterium]|nr:MFS domain-containing histidine kinase [Patescibacteria group bacterium]
NFALVGLAVAAWWLATALITTYVHRLNRRLVMAAVLAPAVISIVILAYWPHGVSAEPMVWFDPSDWACRWLLVSQASLVIVVSYISIQSSKISHNVARSMAMTAALGAVAVMLFLAVGRSWVNVSMTSVAVLGWAFFMVLVVSYLVAHGHPDVLVAEKPTRLLSGSIKAKMAVTAAALAHFPAFVVAAAAGYAGAGTSAFMGLVAASSFLSALLAASAYVATESLIRPLIGLIGMVEGCGVGGIQLVQSERIDEIGQLTCAVSVKIKELDTRVSEMRATVEEREHFLINTAHEMRNPLNTFGWTLDMMRFGDTGPLNKQQLELIEQMNQTTRRLQNVVSNLLDTSRLQKGWLRLKREAVQVEDIIDEIAGVFAVRLREKKINLVWRRQEPATPLAWGDKDRLYQIFINLFGNAVKYARENGRVMVKVAEADEASPGGTQGNFIRVTVIDDGKGIPKDQQRLIGSRFFRARNVMPDEAEGIGLGLYIARRLVEMHGGSLWFESEEGVGSTFSFTVPVVSDALTKPPSDQ